MIMFEKEAFLSVLSECLTENHIEYTPDRLEKLYLFAEDLAETNKLLNLTAITDAEGICLKHFADSLKALEYLPSSGKVADVGCGGGFPLIPLAIFRPDLEFVGIDSTDKKIKFIEKAVRRIGLSNVSAITGRAEELAVGDYREKFDCVISRAVANLPVLVELCVPLVKKDGLFVALKGKNGLEEYQNAQGGIKKLGCECSDLVKYDISFRGVVESRYIVWCKKSQQTPKDYPRQYAKILKKPL